jgi:synaptojanin
MFLAVVTSATEVGNTRPKAPVPEIAAKIHEVGFFCLTSSVWDNAVGVGEILPSPTFPENDDIMSLRDVRDLDYQQNNHQGTAVEHPCMPLTKILSSGTFYYALASEHGFWDISTRLSERLARDRNATRDVSVFDSRFVWNEYIARSMLDFRDRLEFLEKDEFDRCQFLVCLNNTLVIVNYLTVKLRFLLFKVTSVCLK